MSAIELLQQFRNEMLPSVESNCQCVNCIRDREWIIKIDETFEYERPKTNQKASVERDIQAVRV